MAGQLSSALHVQSQKRSGSREVGAQSQLWYGLAHAQPVPAVPAARAQRTTRAIRRHARSVSTGALWEMLVVRIDCFMLNTKKCTENESSISSISLQEYVYKFHKCLIIFIVSKLTATNLYSYQFIKKLCNQESPIDVQIRPSNVFVC